MAVSGGLDSMILLHLLYRLSEKYHWRIAVAHYNHQLRGRSSDADQRLVEKNARILGLNCKVGSADVLIFAKKNHLSVEMAARQLRHEFFANVAKRCKIKTIALAHHADDQVELFFIRVLRGTGTEGLGGMYWKNLSPADTSLHLVRPLLDQTKKTLRDYAEAERVSFREDASNLSGAMLRNRIRHEVIPLLKTIQPSLEKTVLRMMEIAGWDSNFVLGAALEWLSCRKRTPFDVLHIAVQRVCLRLQLRSQGLPSDFELIEELRLAANHVVTVSPTRRVYRDASGQICLMDEKNTAFKTRQKKIDLSKENKIQFGSLEIHWAFQLRKGDVIQRGQNREFFDAEKIGQKICLRHWKAGDRFQPVGMKSPVKLQDFFVNLKIPAGNRRNLVLAETEQGQIFWVEGLRIGECFKLDKQTVRRLKWSWRRV